MGLFTSLLPSKAPQQTPSKKELLYLMGITKFRIEIIGDEQYQTPLELIAGPHKSQGVNCFETASLLLEEKNAVRVEIRQRKVGYLSSEVASLFRQQLIAHGLPKGVGQCAAVIRGGWISSDGRKGPYKVLLDLPAWAQPHQ